MTTPAHHTSPCTLGLGVGVRDYNSQARRAAPPTSLSPLAPHPSSPLAQNNNLMLPWESYLYSSGKGPPASLVFAISGSSSVFTWHWSQVHQCVVEVPRKLQICVSSADFLSDSVCSARHAINIEHECERSVAECSRLIPPICRDVLPENNSRKESLTLEVWKTNNNIREMVTNYDKLGLPILRGSTGDEGECLGLRRQVFLKYMRGSGASHHIYHQHCLRSLGSYQTVSFLSIPLPPLSCSTETGTIKRGKYQMQTITLMTTSM